MPVLRFISLPESRWPNGRGRRADIARVDGWTVCFAWLEADAPFSSLPGHDRTITLVEGLGFQLQIDGRQPLEAPQPFQSVCFDGAEAPRCTISGECLVLSAMTEQSRWRHEIRVLEVAAGERVTPRGAVAAVLLRGAVVDVTEGKALDPFDAVVSDTIDLRATAASALWLMIREPVSSHRPR